MERKNNSTGLLLIVVGLVWLLARLDIISISLWAAVVRLWPLALIGFGLAMIFDHNARLKVVIWILIGCVFLGYGIYIDRYNGFNRNSANSYSQEIPFNADITTGQIKVEVGGCRLKVNEADDTANFMNIDSNIEDLKQSYNSSTQTGQMRLWRTKHNFSTGDFSNDYLGLSLNPTIAWTVAANLGAVEGQLDFSHIDLKSLDLDVGAGDIDIIFAKPILETQLDIDGGVASVTLYIPDDVSLQIDYDGALNKTNFSDFGLQKVGEIYQSPHFDETEPHITMSIDMGVGIIELRHVQVSKTY